ncbi:MAG: hypothetical protein QOI04_72 [Verrucomicrobiota bacterium]|jgi:hypothetical protein
MFTMSVAVKPALVNVVSGSKFKLMVKAEAAPLPAIERTIAMSATFARTSRTWINFEINLRKVFPVFMGGAWAID